MDTSGTNLPAKKSSKWAKGQSGNPRGRRPGSVNRATLLRQRFSESRAQDVLDCVFGNAFNDPTTARWLAARLFGEGRWTSTIAPASVKTVADCKDAMERNFEALCAGSISEDECMAINDALVHRLAILEQTQKA